MATRDDHDWKRVKIVLSGFGDLHEDKIFLIFEWDDVLIDDHVAASRYSIPFVNAGTIVDIDSESSDLIDGHDRNILVRVADLFIFNENKRVAIVICNLGCCCPDLEILGDMGIVKPCNIDLSLSVL